VWRILSVFIAAVIVGVSATDILSTLHKESVLQVVIISAFTALLAEIIGPRAFTGGSRKRKVRGEAKPSITPPA